MALSCVEGRYGQMLFVISVLTVLIAIMLIMLYCCLVVASRQDKYEEEYFRNNKQETDKNEMDKEIIGEEKMPDE